MRFFGYGKWKIILENEFNLLLSIFSNNLDTIDGIYSHSLEKIDSFVKNNSELKEGYISKTLGKSRFSIYAPLYHIKIYTLLAVILLK